MNNVKQAYEVIGSYLLAFAGSRPWDELGCRFSVYGKAASAEHWLKVSGVPDSSGGFEEGTDPMWAGLDAAIYLRDEMLRTTGQRIYGITFTLMPDYKFRIDYDHQQPEGYEESAETVNLDEAVNRLTELGVAVEEGNLAWRQKPVLH